jgi:hypothetical protein
LPFAAFQNSAAVTMTMIARTMAVVTGLMLRRICIHLQWCVNPSLNPEGNLVPLHLMSVSASWVPAQFIA